MKKLPAMAALAILLAACAQAQEVPLHGWKPHDEFGACCVETKGDYIYALEAGASSFGYDPPYRTTVYDLDENPLFTVDGYFAQYYDGISNVNRSGLSDGFGVVWLNEDNESGIEWGVVSDTGEMLMDGLTDVNGVWDGYIYYSRDFGVPLLDKIADRLERKLGVHTGVCGRFNLEGDRLELPGTNLSGPDGQGYMILQLWGWDSPQDSDRFVYVDESGEIAIDYAYEQAWPFVDGSAVVKKGGAYMLIAPDGAEICPISSNWNSGWMSYPRAFSAPVLPMDTPQGMVLVNRRGEVVNDTPYAEVQSDMIGWLHADILVCVDDAGISHFVDAQGEVLFSLPLENWRWHSNDPDVLWAQQDGLWGRLDVQGIYGEPGQYTSADRYLQVEHMDEDLTVGQKTDGSWVAIGEMGEAAGPAEAPDYDEWK